MKFTPVILAAAIASMFSISAKAAVPIFSDNFDSYAPEDRIGIRLLPAVGRLPMVQLIYSAQTTIIYFPATENTST